MTSAQERYARAPNHSSLAPATAVTTSTIGAGAFARRAGIERRLGVVLDSELNGLRQLRPGLAADKVQRHVDPGRDAGRGDELAVLDEATADGVGAQLPQLLEEEPVRRRPPTVQQAGGGEHE